MLRGQGRGGRRGLDRDVHDDVVDPGGQPFSQCGGELIGVRLGGTVPDEQHPLTAEACDLVRNPGQRSHPEHHARGGNVVDEVLHPEPSCSASHG